ncbi:peptide deformylase [Zavarzinia sp. CC-PAN008]|uniref:peptide deformylase n=1 Tax=Zavarzinia sp. CC-PAN008 TaxID=3243332 RepID=UPI003F742A80
MTVRPILRMGHPILKRRADPVPDPTAPEIGLLLADMEETMRAARGRGIAAPQIGVPLQVVIFHAPPTPDIDRMDLSRQPLTVLINPRITVLDATAEDDWEGCLSVPGLKGLVPRHRRIRYEGFDHEGNTIVREAEGFHARVVQHECDHLDGTLYPQRMRDMASLEYTDAFDD